MKIGQKISVIHDRRRSPHSVQKGIIIAIEPRYVVVQYKNYRECFLKVDIENNLDRDFFLK